MNWITEFWMALEKKRFDWGVHDCLIFAADALVVQGRPDPAGPYRGVYSSAAEAQAVIDSAGGFVPLFESACDGAGIGEAAPYRTGAVAIVRPEGKPDATVGAMWSGRDWWFVSMRGIGAVERERMEVISTWRH